MFVPISDDETGNVITSPNIKTSKPRVLGKNISKLKMFMKSKRKHKVDHWLVKNTPPRRELSTSGNLLKQPETPDTLADSPPSAVAEFTSNRKDDAESPKICQYPAVKRSTPTSAATDGQTKDEDAGFSPAVADDASWDTKLVSSEEFSVRILIVPPQSPSAEDAVKPVTLAQKFDQAAEGYKQPNDVDNPPSLILEIKERTPLAPTTATPPATKEQPPLVPNTENPAESIKEQPTLAPTPIETAGDAEPPAAEDNTYTTPQGVEPEKWSSVNFGEEVVRVVEQSRREFQTMMEKWSSNTTLSSSADSNQTDLDKELGKYLAVGCVDLASIPQDFSQSEDKPSSKEQGLLPNINKASTTTTSPRQFAFNKEQASPVKTANPNTNNVNNTNDKWLKLVAHLEQERMQEDSTYLANGDASKETSEVRRYRSPEEKGLHPETKSEDPSIPNNANTSEEGSNNQKEDVNADQVVEEMKKFLYKAGKGLQNISVRLQDMSVQVQNTLSCTAHVADDLIPCRDASNGNNKNHSGGQPPDKDFDAKLILEQDWLTGADNCGDSISKLSNPPDLHSAFSRTFSLDLTEIEQAETESYQ